MKTRQHYVQKAREAAWIISHLKEADKKLFSGDPELQKEGAKERNKYLTRWQNWSKANPDEAKMAEKIGASEVVIQSHRTNIITNIETGALTVVRAGEE